MEKKISKCTYIYLMCMLYVVTVIFRLTQHALYFCVFWFRCCLLLLAKQVFSSYYLYLFLYISIYGSARPSLLFALLFFLLLSFHAFISLCFYLYFPSALIKHSHNFFVYIHFLIFLNNFISFLSSFPLIF